MPSRPPGPGGDRHANTPRGGEAKIARSQSDRDFMQTGRGELLDPGDSDALFLPSTPPEHSCDSLLSPSAHAKRERGQRAWIKELLNEPEKVFKERHLMEYFRDMEEEPQELDYCQFKNLKNKASWMDEARLERVPWELTDELGPGTDRIDDHVGTLTPVTLEMARDHVRFGEMEWEAGSPPWRPRDDRETREEEPIDITIARHQVAAYPGTGAEVTVVSAQVWARYVQIARECGLNIDDYEDYRRMSRKQRVSKRWSVMIGGRQVQTHGPFNCWVQIGCSSLKCPVYVTADHTLGRSVVPGRDLWQTVPIKVCRSKPTQNEAEAWIEAHDQVFRALLDTGAGPNIITKTALEKMGTRGGEVKPTTTTLSMADNTRMKVMGE